MLILRILIAISVVAELISLEKNRNGVEGCVEYERSEGMILFWGYMNQIWILLYLFATGAMFNVRYIYFVVWLGLN